MCAAGDSAPNQVCFGAAGDRVSRDRRFWRCAPPPPDSGCRRAHTKLHPPSLTSVAALVLSSAFNRLGPVQQKQKPALYAFDSNELTDTHQAIAHGTFDGGGGGAKGPLPSLRRSTHLPKSGKRLSGGEMEFPNEARNWMPMLRTQTLGGGGVPLSNGVRCTHGQCTICQYFEKEVAKRGALLRMLR